MLASLRQRILLLLVLLAPISIAPMAAHAQEEEARLLFEQGNEHLARGLRARGRTRARELEQALDAYQGVLRMGARTRNVVFNTALTLAELGRDQDAFNYFSEYLRAFDLSEDERAEGTRRIDAIRPRVAVLSVESTPPGAEVRIDRRDLPVRGTTPIAIAVNEGERRVFLDREGFQSAEVSASAVIGRSANVQVELTPNPVMLQVIAPGRGRLTLDGQEITAGRSIPVAPGAHVVRLELSGQPPTERHFEVRPGDAPIRLELSATGQGRSEVAIAIDEDADVFIDDAFVGSGRELALPIAPGPHRIRVEATGFTPLDQTLSIDPESTLHLEVDLGLRVDRSGVEIARAVLGTFAILGLGAAIGLGSYTYGLNDQYEEGIRLQTSANPPLSAAELRALADRIDGFALMTDIAWGITAGIGIAAIVFLIIDPGSDEESSIRIGRNRDGTLAASFVWGGL